MLVLVLVFVAVSVFVLVLAALEHEASPPAVSTKSPEERLRTQEEPPREQGNAMCTIVFDVHYRPVFSESLLGLESLLGNLLFIYSTSHWFTASRKAEIFLVCAMYSSCTTRGYIS